MNTVTLDGTDLTKAQVRKGIILTVSFVLLRLVGAKLWEVWFGMKYHFSIPFLIFLLSVFLVMSLGIIVGGLGGWVRVDLKGWWFKRGQIAADIGWAIGTLLGLGCLAIAGAIILAVCGAMPSSFKTGQESGSLEELPARLVLGLFFGFAIASFGEETLFRGFWQEAAGKRFGAWKGNLLQAALFSVAHLGLESIEKAAPLLLVRFGFGVLLGWLRMKRGTLLTAGMVHGLVG